MNLNPDSLDEVAHESKVLLKQMMKDMKLTPIAAGGPSRINHREKTKKTRMCKWLPLRSSPNLSAP